jgi:type IV pilus assembly protein PilY1
MFLAFVHPNNWWGQVTANALYHDSGTDSLKISGDATWDANCVLTGGSCDAMAGNATITAQDPAARAILTWNGSTGVPFQWNRISTAQQTALTAGDAKDDTRLKYLRGDRTKEVDNGGSFRSRTGVLADVTDSSPTWVGPPDTYPGTFADKLGTGAAPEGSSYDTFASTNLTRMNVVYAGANDGMLHGFRAGNFDSNGNFAATANDGREVLAYVPSQALATIHSTTPSLDYSGQQYAHNFFVDGPPGVGDLYYGKAWHTWLVGGLGPGGQAGGAISDPGASAGGALFALDVTDPSKFSEANAASLVVGEISSTSFTSCINVPGACNANLGLAWGTPLIRRLHDGNWAVLFGNGLNSANGGAGLFILHVDSATGNRTLRYLDTGYGISRDPLKAGNRNGIVQVSSSDLDADHVTDHVYAGDAFGNLWRFDLTSADPSKCSVGSAPLFSTPAGQPITTQAHAVFVPSPATGGRKVVVTFGTGQKLPQTVSDAESYASGSQAIYGIWDWDMSAWNAKSATVKFDALAAPQAITTAKLQGQKVTSTVAGDGDITGYRSVSRNVVCWYDSTTCKTGNTKYGWMLPLPTSGEQVVFNPSIQLGMFWVNTLVPATQQILTCSSTPPSGYTMFIDYASGGAMPSKSADNGTGLDDVAGYAADGVGTVMLAHDQENGKDYIVQQTRNGGHSKEPPVVPTGGVAKRMNWTKLR